MKDLASTSAEELDADFFQKAEVFFHGNAHVALTFDDVSLSTRYSEILPKEANLSTSLSESVKLHIPILSSDMDTVTEAPMAIALSLNGGMGLIHYNMPAKAQIKEISRVKRHIQGLIQDPISIAPDSHVGDVLDLIEKKAFAFRTFPVVDENRKLLGLLSGKVVKERYRDLPVSRAMTPRDQLVTLLEKEISRDPIQAADRFFTEHIGIHKLLVVDEENRLRGLLTLSDVEKIMQEAKSLRKPSRDSSFRLMVGAAIAPVRDSTGKLDRNHIVGHVGHLVDEGVDAVAISTAHGHTIGVGEMIKMIRENFGDLTIIAGNVTSAAGVEFLAGCGANAIKVGQGSGSICTTRLIAGVGVPQLTAIYVASRVARKKGVKILSDGGITKSGDITKALTLADAVICGSLLAGCREAPGDIVEIDGKLYKQYRGMGSLAAMKMGSASRYGHEKLDTVRKATAEGIEALKEVSGSVDNTLSDLIGGIQSGMGYLGAANLSQLRDRACYIRVSSAGLKEAAPHDVIEVSTRKD
ncbi:MAG: IMP dehydrogenase [Opitutales bacterium]